MRKFDLSLRSSRSSYFATFRHQLTILSKTDALDEEKWLNMLGTFVKDWFRYESHFVHGRDSLDRKSGSAGMPRPISYAVFCLKKKTADQPDHYLRLLPFFYYHPHPPILLSFPTRRSSDLSSRSSYFATFRHQLTILSKTDALDEEKWLNMLGTFVKDWFRYESHFVHGRDSLVDILKERGLLSESDAVQPLIGKKSLVKLLNNPYVSRPLWPLLSSFRLLPFWI